MPPVTFDDLGERACAPAPVNVVEVGDGEPGPAGLKFDADRAASEVGGLDERRADSAHGIDHEVAGVAVGFDREHLGGVPV
jgi:hypothetical protein